MRTWREDKRLEHDWSIRSFTGANYQTFRRYVVPGQLCVPRALCPQILGSYTVFTPNLTQRSVSQSFSGAIHHCRTWRRLSPQTWHEGEPGSTLRPPRSTSRCGGQSCVSATWYQRNTVNRRSQLCLWMSWCVIYEILSLHNRCTTPPAFVSALDLMWMQPLWVHGALLYRQSMA